MEQGRAGVARRAGPARGPAPPLWQGRPGAGAQDGPRCVARRRYRPRAGHRRGADRDARRALVIAWRTGVGAVMPTLIFSGVGGVDRSSALGAEPVTVGRSAECAIRSDDPRVSRMHARFYVDQGALWVEDLGSSNGIFVGPNKGQRRPGPTGEIILVGSLLIRLLPASGTLPPPMGLHGTLASWLDMERKARATIEDERDAFARRVGEMHHQLASVMSARTIDPDEADLRQARDAAEHRATALERALGAVQGQLAPGHEKISQLQAGISDRADWAGDTSDTSETARSIKLTQDVSRLSAELEEAERARSIAEHAHGEAMREAQVARDELLSARKAAAAELEAAR